MRSSATTIVRQMGTALVGLGLSYTAVPEKPAEAYTTRLHIVIANKVREAAIAGSGTLKMKLGDGSVTWSAADLKAIIEHPLEFRAGAIGPDNMVFPALTDPSHAIEQRPFEQCQLLYDAAVVDAERAYAIGCFLHGATDAVAHHYVNFMTGETFTLTPLSAGRKSAWSNVVRHIASESMIQASAFKLDARAFSAGSLDHTIPMGFVLRTYMDETSPLFKVMAKVALEKYTASKLANPTASMATVISKAGLAPAEKLSLAPVFLNEIEASRKAIRATIVKRIASMQDRTTAEGAKLKVTAGPDGKMGTADDLTSCSASCPIDYSNYFVRVRLLAPRYDAGGRELPSAFDKVSDKLGADLFQLLPSMVQTIESISSKLNGPLSSTSDGFDLTKADLNVAFGPMLKWSDTITTVDYETLARTVTPDWLTSLSDAFSSVGVRVSISGLLSEVLRPIVQPIKDAVKVYVIDEAQTYLGTLIDEYKANYSTINKEFTTRLNAAAGTGLTGNMLDHFFDSGLWTHSFNIAAAAIARHELVLPEFPDSDVGPATFDASYTPAWMQAGACEYLRVAIFPLGIDVKGSLSVKDATGTFAGKVDRDAPVECHNGLLTTFTSTPSVEVCKLVSLATLLKDPTGSVSRSYPPLVAELPASCRNLTIPGLPPPPPPVPDAGVDVGSDAGSDLGVSDTATLETGPDTGIAVEDTSFDDSGAVDDLGNPIDPGAETGKTAGCSCHVPQADPTHSPMSALSLCALGIGAIVIRRRRRVAALAATVSLLSVSCSAGGGDSSPPDDVQSDTRDDTAAVDTALEETSGDAGTEVGLDGEADTLADSGDTSPADVADTTVADVEADTSVADTASDSAPDTVPDVPTENPLLKALGDSVWFAEQTRLFDTKFKKRAYEISFRSSELIWSETQNPYGPARARERRVFVPLADGKTVKTTVITPAGWPITARNGIKEDWTLEVIAGTPRKLKVTRLSAPVEVETFVEGAWPKPTSGLTATVNVFSSTGKVNEAFCTAGAGSFDYKAVWDFARGRSTEPSLGQDVVAGAKLLRWRDLTGANKFAVTDVDGFDKYGGTELSDQFNFVVTYTGSIKQTGGLFKMREKDDVVEDAVWSFLNTKVGSSLVSDMFLEVHGFIWADKTVDEPSVTFTTAGEVPVEIMVVRCAKTISDVDVEVSINGSGTWTLVGNVPSVPKFDAKVFPPAL